LKHRAPGTLVMPRKKKHVAATAAVDGFREAFCGRMVTDDFDSPSEVVTKIRKGLFRRELHCGSCLRAPELSELIYVHSE
jgi:hypothetical protein